VTPLTKLCLAVFLIAYFNALGEQMPSDRTFCDGCKIHMHTPKWMKIHAIFYSLFVAAFAAGIVNLIVSAFVGAYRGGWL
jgi:hypothetical protein